MTLLKVGLIGCGRIGSLLEEDPLREKPCSHVGGFHSVSSAKMVAGCDIDSDRLDKFGKRWGVTQLYQDYREMLYREDLDIVCIATWTHLHGEMVVASARAGVKGIFCEKPIAVDMREAKSMVRICQRKGIPLVINHERRWDPYYQQAGKIINAGKIGEVRTIVGNALSWKPGKLPVRTFGGGGMLHDGTHLIDLLRYFGGEVDWVAGHETRPYGKQHIEETACAMLCFQSGALGFVEGGGARKYFNFDLDIQGSEGRLLIGNAGRELFITKKSKRFSGFHELERVPFPEPRSKQSPFFLGARGMVRCVQQVTKNISSGHDGLKALEVVYGIYQSAKLKGKRIKLT